MRTDEQDVIEKFVDHLGILKGHSNLSVDRWPDKENRTEPEIDAVAGIFAIEHTSIDSVASQRQLDDWYLRVVGGLDQLISECLDCGFTVTLEFYAIGKGMDWNCIREDLQKWIVHRAPLLENGNHEIVLPTSTPVEFPIVMHIEKGLPLSSVGFRRFAPKDNTLAARTKKILDRKSMKLRKYQGDYTTILLVENAGFPLIVGTTIVDAIQVAFPDILPHGADEIWVIDTDTEFIMRSRYRT